MYEKFLSENCYVYFILLHVAIRLLLEKNTCQSRAPYANELLRLFVKVSPKLYGDKFVPFNVHNLIHLAKDVERHGSLDEFSAFLFEKKLRVLTSMLKESGRPLEQIVRRLDEENRIKRPSNAFSLEGKHFSGPLLQSVFPSCVQYHELIFKDSFFHK